MKVRIITLGCKVNQFESQAMLNELTKNGWTIADDNESADVSIINSCAVTQVSEQKAVKLIHRIKRENPDSVIVLTGCMAQAFPQSGQRLPEVDIVLGNKRRGDLLPVLDQFFLNRERLTCVTSYSRHDDYENLHVSNFVNRTRAYLKIEDGCNRFCSYCIIPYARGRVRSCSPEYISNEVRTLAGNGYKEIVIIGINLSSYGSDNGLTLADAIRTACESADVRIRLGSLEPESMDLPMLKMLSGFKNFCPQFHLSLQSGCDETLRRMNRHYSTKEYADIVRNIRHVFPNPSVTTDVMVGFAGETEEEFGQSLDFVRQTGFARVHIFPYSRRPGTAADRYPDQISPAVKKKRAAIMAEAAEEGTASFLQSQIGLIEEVLVETLNSEGLYEGYTMNYTPVWFSADESAEGKLVRVKITGAEDDHCIGRIVDTV